MMPHDENWERSEARARLNGIELDYAVRGPAQGVPLLLIMGLGMQRIAWPDALLDAWVDAGYRCISFDNRDIGLTTRYTEHGLPALAAVVAARLLRRRYRLPYTLSDIADDGAALLDHLGYRDAHVLGISMGGMIAQRFAERHAGRTRTLTLMATSSGRLGLPMPRGDVLRLMLSRPSGSVGLEAAVDYLVRLFSAIGSPAYPSSPEAIRLRASIGVRRAPVGSGVSRQLAAIISDGDRSAMLRQLRVPTLVLHGQADPLVPFAHGVDLAKSIPGARLEAIPGWGHDLPEALAPRFAALLSAHARD